jgi:hypothetical protein
VCFRFLSFPPTSSPDRYFFLVFPLTFNPRVPFCLSKLVLTCNTTSQIAMASNNSSSVSADNINPPEVTKDPQGATRQQPLVTADALGAAAMGAGGQDLYVLLSISHLF